MKKKFLAVFLVTGIMTSLTMSVFSSNITSYLNFKNNNLIESQEDYKLNNPLTRYDAIKMIANISGYFEDNKDYNSIKKLGNFADATSEQEYYLGVGVKIGVLRPMYSKTVKPNEVISKKEFGTYLLRMLAVKENVNVEEELKKYGVNVDKFENTLNIYEATDMIFNVLDEEVKNGMGSTYVDTLINRGILSKHTAEKLGLKYNKVVDNDIHILYFNDFHGNITEEVTAKRRQFGMSKMVSYVNEYMKAHPNTIVLSGGDNYQGTADSNLTYGKPVSEMMKGMKVTASAVGNHEFDWGVDKINNWAKDGKITYLASNIYDVKTKKPVKWAKPYIIKELNGMKVGIIGLAHPDTPTLTKAENVENIKFGDPIKYTKKWVKYLKSGKAKEGKPDIIVALTHIDSSQDSKTGEITGNAADIANSVKDVDVILSAHSHREVNGEVNGVKIIQASCFGRAMGVVDIVNKNDITTNLYTGIDIKDTILTDNKTDKYYNELQKNLLKIKGEVIGELTAPLVHSRTDKGSNSLLGRWSSESLREKMGVDLVVNNGGLLRRTLEQGKITMGDMYEIAPFDNTLVTLKMKGKDIKQVLDHGIMMPKTTDGQFYGMKVYYDSKLPYEKKIVKLETLDGKEVDMEKYYTVCINEFILTGGDGYDFSKAIDVKDTNLVLRDVLVEIIKEQKTITPKSVDYIEDVSK